MAATRKAVVIGSGAGGLAAAAYLAKGGAQVTLLERAPVIGGYINSFNRKGYCFDPGVHYVGECRPGQGIHRVFAGLDLDADNLFCELDRDGFDRYRFPGLEVRVPRGFGAFQDRLTDLFPSEKKNIERFFALARELAEASRAMTKLSFQKPALSDLTLLRHVPTLLRWGKATYKQLLDWITPDPKLQAVLAANCGDYGLPPSRASALYGLMLHVHYSDGAFFPRGGSGRMKDKLVDYVKARGGTVRTRAEVAEIIVNKRRAVGVRLSGGEEIPADKIVSAIDPILTFGKLIKAEHLPERLMRKVNRTEPSVGMFYVFLGMKRDLRQHGLGAFDIWDYPDWDLDAMYAPLFAGRMPTVPAFFLSPNSLKDDSGECAPKGSSTLEIITVAPYELFSKWDGQPSNRRGTDYLQLKNTIGDGLLKEVERRHPGLIGDIEVQEYATPLSNSYWAGAVRGGSYGPAMTPNQVGPFRFQTAAPIRNLFLAGAGVFGGGVSPSLASGVVAARMALRD